MCPNRLAGGAQLRQEKSGSTRRAEVEGKNRQDTEDCLDKVFPLTAASRRVGAMEPRKQLGRGDARERGGLGPDEVGDVVRRETSSLDRNEDA
jgi:hypothetical protein